MNYQTILLATILANYCCILVNGQPFGGPYTITCNGIYCADPNYAVNNCNTVCSQLTNKNVCLISCIPTASWLYDNCCHNLQS